MWHKKPSVKSEIINVFEDDEVYKKIRKDEKPKTLLQLKPLYMHVKPKKDLLMLLSITGPTIKQPKTMRYLRNYL